MSTIELRKFSNYHEAIYFSIGKVYDFCTDISMKFETGNVYCIDSSLTCGGLAISWLFTGLLTPKKLRKYIPDYAFWDGKGMTYRQIKEFGFAVGLTGLEGTFLIRKNVGVLLDKLVKNSSRVNSIDELQELFMLSEPRFDRPIKCYSRERWRATIAMGYAMDRKIFCFPWMRPGIISTYKDLWIKKALKPLVEADCLVIIPTVFREEMTDLFTKVVSFGESEGHIYGEPIEIREFPGSYL